MNRDTQKSPKLHEFPKLARNSTSKTQLAKEQVQRNRRTRFSGKKETHSARSPS